MTPTTRPGTALAQLTDSVLTASRVLVGVAARSLAVSEEISIAQYRALVVLGAKGPQRPVDLAVALGVDPSTVTRLCDRLVDKQLISRGRRDTDRREVHLALTTRGTRLLDEVTTRRRDEIQRILEAIPPRERQGLLQAFAVFSAAAGEVPEAQWARSWDL